MNGEKDWLFCVCENYQNNHSLYDFDGSDVSSCSILLEADLFFNRKEERHGKSFEPIQGTQQRGEAGVHERSDVLHGGDFCKRPSEDDGRNDAFLHEHDEIKGHGHGQDAFHDEGHDGMMLYRMA
jgi:hypothetical protein